MCDSVVGVESFAGSDKETNPMFKDYHGEWVWLVKSVVHPSSPHAVWAS